MNEKYGIDVSMAQGVIDWDRLAENADLSFAIIRAAQGTAQDSRFARNIKECERVGIPYGLYFAASATTEEDVRKEAAFAAGLLTLYRPQYGAWYDMELAKHRALGKAKITELMRTWLAYVSGEGCRCGIYTNKDWLDNRIDHALLAECDLWYAAYPSTSPKGLSDAPEDNRPKLSYPQAAIWQWSSAGKVDGITGNVDLNVCYEDFAPPYPDDGPKDGYVTLDELGNLLRENGVQGIIV